MTEADIEIILQAAKEKYPEARPRIISDNGPQFIAKDFKEFIRISGMTHVRTSPYYPQSNGKIERWHKSLKSECIRPGTPLSLDDARRLVEGYVKHWNKDHAEGHSPLDEAGELFREGWKAGEPPRCCLSTGLYFRPICDISSWNGPARGRLLQTLQDAIGTEQRQRTGREDITMTAHHTPRISLGIAILMMALGARSASAGTIYYTYTGATTLMPHHPSRHPSSFQPPSYLPAQSPTISHSQTKLRWSSLGASTMASPHTHRPTPFSIQYSSPQTAPA